MAIGKTIFPFLCFVHVFFASGNLGPGLWILQKTSDHENSEISIGLTAGPLIHEKIHTRKYLTNKTRLTIWKLRWPIGLKVYKVILIGFINLLIRATQPEN